MLTVSSHVMGTTPREGLQYLLGTCDAEAFLREHFGRQVLYVSADSQRFEDLFSWNDLNKVLNQGFVFHPRARLLKEGVAIDPASYTYEMSGRQFPDSHFCQQLLASGATLILEAAERINPRLDAFINGLRRDFRAEVNCGIAATCALVRGLGLHWDPYECFNIQIDGEKEWQIFAPSRAYPLNPTKRFPQRRDAVPSRPPDGPPIWTGVMKPGDVLYLPRGCWHSVTPRVVPSLHITIGIDVPTLSDFLLWYVRESTRHESMRQMLPTWNAADEQVAFAQDALASVLPTLSTDIIASYLSQTGAPPRREFVLPTAAAPDGPPVTNTTRIRLRSLTPLPWMIIDGQVTFEWLGEKYYFNARVVPALERINEMKPWTVKELCSDSEPILVKTFVRALLNAGVVVVTAQA